MRSWLTIAPPLSSMLLLWFAASQQSKPQTPVKKTPPSLEQSVRPFFAKNCTSCHNPKDQAGALDLQTLRGTDSFKKSRDIWESVVRKIRTGEMPPKDSPRPADIEIKSTILKIEAKFERVDRTVASNPGSVTAHRLNRAEYNNTVRDLLGVNFHPADDFPQDDSGYGFDNNGDVLSLSSSQMEKYVAASEKIARTAIFGPEMLKPTLVRHEAQGRRVGNLFTVPAKYDVTGLTLTNSLHTSHRFPVDGEYIVRFGLNGQRPLGSDGLHFGLWIDGKKYKSIAFDPTGTASFSTDRQDFSAYHVEWRERIPAGDHWIDATIENLFEGLPAEYAGPNPSHRTIPQPEFKLPPNFPKERIEEFRKRFEARKKEKVSTNDVRISTVDIGGPYSQSKGPSEESLKQVFVCGHLHGGHQPDCARKIIGVMARRAFRRTVTSQEIDRFTGLVTLAKKQGDTFEEGICLAMQGILVSPHFLFRIERDSPTVKSDAAHLISQHELASRLSYFLWSSMPDEELRTCADAQTLSKPAVLAAQVKRMLKDPKSHALAENFGGQWLQIRALESFKPDKGKFPDFDEYLRKSMWQETELFFDSIVREDRSILDLLLGKYTYLNGRMANFYGIPGVDGPEFRKVDLTGTSRGGILTQASVLTVTSYPNRTSPVLRGKWILENILNAPPPAAPPGVPNLDVTAVGSATSLRQQLEEHRKNPTCAACHARMDPLGFGLENFNAIGEWRTNDGKIAIDPSGSLPDGRTFTGPDGLRTILDKDRDDFTQCMTSKLLTYALGRGLERYDRSTVTDIAKHVAAQNNRFSSLIMEIVSSRPFQMRKGDRTK